LDLKKGDEKILKSRGTRYPKKQNRGGPYNRRGLVEKTGEQFRPQGKQSTKGGGVPSAWDNLDGSRATVYGRDKKSRKGSHED